MVVEKGNKVSIPADTLGEGKGKKITVQWSQEMRNMTSDYWVSKFTNQTTNSIDLVFVQVDMLPKLITKSDPNEHYVFTIDSEWQYGQAKGLSNRFIVYQNTRNKQFMHRFIQPYLTTYRNEAAEALTQMGYPVSDPKLAMVHFADFLKGF